MSPLQSLEELNIRVVVKRGDGIARIQPPGVVGEVDIACPKCGEDMVQQFSATDEAGSFDAWWECPWDGRQPA